MCTDDLPRRLPDIYAVWWSLLSLGTCGPCHVGTSCLHRFLARSVSEPCWSLGFEARPCYCVSICWHACMITALFLDMALSWVDLKSFLLTPVQCRRLALPAAPANGSMRTHALQYHVYALASGAIRRRARPCSAVCAHAPQFTSMRFNVRPCVFYWYLWWCRNLLILNCLLGAIESCVQKSSHHNLMFVRLLSCSSVAFDFR